MPTNSSKCVILSVGNKVSMRFRYFRYLKYIKRREEFKMDENVKEELIIKAASKVHEDWCMQELRAFWERAKANKEKGMNEGEAIRNACFKGEQKRNEVFTDVAFLTGHETLASTCLDNFEDFMKLVNYDAIEVKRFAKRNLTKEEIKNGISSGNYKAETGEENILRPFKKLSSDSRKENLEAAIGAFNVYSEMSKAGISIEQMESDPKIKDMIGVAIHTDWLKRNMEHPNESLKVPYSQLDEWTKGQDLTVFYALIGVVKQNIEQYKIAAENGYELPNYTEEEVSLLESSGRKI